MQIGLTGTVYHHVVGVATPRVGGADLRAIARRPKPDDSAYLVTEASNLHHLTNHRHSQPSPRCVIKRAVRLGPGSGCALVCPRWMAPLTSRSETLRAETPILWRTLPG